MGACENNRTKFTLALQGNLRSALYAGEYMHAQRCPASAQRPV